jgi:hypothetical protein
VYDAERFGSSPGPSFQWVIRFTVLRVLRPKRNRPRWPGAVCAARLGLTLQQSAPSDVHSRIEFTREAAYHLLVALPIPSILVGLAFLKARNGTRVALLAGSLVLFVVIYVVSYMLFCIGCT